MPRRISSPVLVGRTIELEHAQEALKEVEGGRSRTLLIEGELGVGKTRLAGEIAALASARGARVLTGRCLAAAGSVPYAAFREALRTLPDLLPESELQTVVGPATHDLRRLLPVSHSGARAASDDPVQHGNQGRLFESLLGCMERLSAAAPLVLVIEDLHWAQTSSRHLFAYIVHNLHGSRALVIGTFRSDMGTRHPLRSTLSQLMREPSVDRIELSGLSRDQTARLVEAIRAERASPDLVDSLVRRTGGNPFFIEEILASHQSPDETFPAGLRDPLRARSLEVSDDARSVLCAAAVAGLQCDELLLEALTGLKGRQLWEPLRELVDSHLLLPEPGRDRAVYRFRHALLREVVDEDLLPGERIDLHARVAEFLTTHPDAAIGGLSTVAGEVASHWEAARQPAQALPSHLEAADEARAVFAFPEAARHLERAVAIWGRLDPEQRPASLTRWALLGEAADAVALNGDPAKAITLARSAIADVDLEDHPSEAALLYERLGRYLWEKGEDAAGRQAIQQALALLPPPPSAQRARLLTALASLLLVSGHPGEARPLAMEAVDVARLVGDRGEEGRARNASGLIAAAGGNLETGLSDLLSARAIAEEVGAVYERIRAYVNHAAALGNAGRLTDALGVATEGLAVARELGVQRSHGGYLLTNAIVALFALGRWNQVESLIAETPGVVGSGVLEAHLHLVRAQLLVARGEFEEAGRNLRAAGSFGEHSEDPVLVSSLSGARAELALWSGHPTTAWELLQRGVERIPLEATGQMVEVLPLAARITADRAELARARRRDDEVAAARTDLVAWLERFRAISEEPQSQLPGLQRALYAADAEAARLEGMADPQRYGRAADAYAAVEQPYPAAYLRYRQAEAILGHTRARTEAAPLLKSAREVARDLGARPLLEAIEGLARRARLELDDEACSPPEAREPSAVDRLGLSKRELEVLALLSAGLTNRHIAEQLFISPKTAGAHVSNIIGKLGVSGRVEAATIAERLGITAKVTSSAE